jgi:hypothetical protein
MAHPGHVALLQEAAGNGVTDGAVHTFVFIGDPSQLPPVGHNGVSPALLQPITAQLNKVHRHGGPVLRLATEIRCGENLRPPLTESIAAADSSVIVHPDCASWWQAFLAAATDAPNPDHARLIAFTNNAVSRYNAHARAYFRGADASPFVADELVVTHGGVYSLDDVKKSPFKAEPMYGTSREIVIASAKPMMLPLDGAAK